MGARSLIHCATREVPNHDFLKNSQQWGFAGCRAVPPYNGERPCTHTPCFWIVERLPLVSCADGLRGLAPRSPLSAIAHRDPRGVAAKVSTSPQAKASQSSPPVALWWPCMTNTSATWVPLPVTDPAEVPSTLGKPSLTTPVSPEPTRDTGGLASFSGSPLSHSWPQSTWNLPRPPQV